MKKITTQAQYDAVKKELGVLAKKGPHPDTPDGQRLQQLVAAIVLFEEEQLQKGAAP